MNVIPGKYNWQLFSIFVAVCGYRARGGVADMLGHNKLRPSVGPVP